MERYVGNEITYRLNLVKKPLDRLVQHVDQFLTQDRYLRYSDINSFKVALQASATQTSSKVFELLEHPYAGAAGDTLAIRQHMTKVLGAIRPGSTLLVERNKAFVEKEISTYKEFFDTVEKTPLTLEQRHAAIIFEDRNLLVASAGSGKSSTLVGKAGYAVQRKLFEPSEIVALAFNRDAAKELNERINLRIKPWLGGKAVKAHTFHALGSAIVRSVARRDGRKVRVGAEHEEKPRLRAVVEELKRTPSFLGDWINFLSICREPIPADDAFNSFEDYERYVEQQRKARRNGEPAAFQTLSGHIVRSAEELAIANWLYIQGVPFEYERPFEPVPDAWDKYQPDFYYPEIGVWHEHFALNAEGKAPAHFPNYEITAQVKREWLNTQVPGKWFETRSHQHRAGSIFAQLESLLKKYGQEFRPRSSQEILEGVQHLGQTDALDLLMTVLHLVKSNCFDRAAFSACVESTFDVQRSRQFEKVFWPVSEAYNQRLYKEGKIDFDDMIVRSAEYLKQRQVESPFKLILVDEFQDMSPGRARMVKALLAQHSDSVLFGVGDDWQAINGFAGSDLRLFMKFPSEFGVTHEGALTKTFRCAQGIADVGSMFIQRNQKGQKAKVVTSELDKTTSGTVDLVDIGRDDDLAHTLEIALAELAQKVLTESGPVLSVYLLSRYGISKTAGIDGTWLERIRYRFSEFLEISFMTMHQSKGLEADYVFLLGVNAGWGLTFPSTMTNDPLIDMLQTYRDPFPYAEERRLFYVALTRAKKRATVIFRQFNPSPFVLELMEPRYLGRVTYRGDDLPEACNQCGKGFLVRRHGPYGPFLGCTRYRSSDGGCRHTRKLR